MENCLSIVFLFLIKLRLSVLILKRDRMRSVKHGRRKCRRRINYSKNSAAAKKKAMKRRKAMDGITCKQMRIAWDKNSTIKQNMKAMGLAYDSNKLFPLEQSINKHCEEMEIDELKPYGSIKSQMLKTKSTVNKSKIAKVITALEKEAEEEKIKQKKGRSYRLLARDIEFCIYMIEKHGGDYEARPFI
ncbi:unnamed protein product [Brugia pahangi]|uniref:Nucleolar protein 16 n=1 Tax=Brugia pahangi TaxID=6280 RepID=A0A158PRN0_BRUPA|nr:unnamed protein product [Brugia pahangi]